MKYDIRFIKQEYERYDGKTFNETAIVSFKDIDGKEVINKYGKISTENIYKMIYKEKSINLDNCFIEGFSLNEYRKERKLKNNAYITLNNFTASESFFDKELCLCYAHYIGAGVNFNKSIFNCCGIFSNSSFGNRFVDFSLSVFRDSTSNNTDAYSGEVCTKFDFSIFGKGEISFNGVKFGNNTMATFTKVRFGEGELDFRGVQGYTVSFTHSQFNSYLNLQACNIRHLDFRNVISRDIIDLNYFGNYRPTTIETMNVCEMKNLGAIFLNWKGNKVKSLIDNQTRETKREKAEQFRLLKENFRKIGKYYDEDKAYLELMKNEIRAEKDENTSKWKVTSILFNLFNLNHTLNLIGLN